MKSQETGFLLTAATALGDKDFRTPWRAGAAADGVSPAVTAAVLTGLSHSAPGSAGPAKRPLRLEF